MGPLHLTSIRRICLSTQGRCSWSRARRLTRLGHDNAKRRTSRNHRRHVERSLSQDVRLLHLSDVPHLEPLQRGPPTGPESAYAPQLHWGSSFCCYFCSFSSPARISSWNLQKSVQRAPGAISMKVLQNPHSWRRVTTENPPSGMSFRVWHIQLSSGFL